MLSVKKTLANLLNWFGFRFDWSEYTTNNTADTWVPVFVAGKIQHRVIPKQYNETLQSLLAVEQKIFSGTWAANGATTISGSIAKTGYTPIGIVGASSAHGSVTLIRFYTSGNTGYVEGRSALNTSVAASPWVRVLYIKEP